MPAESPLDHDEALRRFAWRIAGPREAAINIAINGAIAWWLFGGRSNVPLLGDGSVFSMLLPMSFILSTLTSFFGQRLGAIERRRRPTDAAPLSGRWYAGAIGRSLLAGVVGLAISFTVYLTLQRLTPAVILSPRATIATIAAVAAAYAYLLHSAAVMIGSARGSQ